MSSTHLLLLSLGPVQDFIAAARRCQDLWYGSYMLSELSRSAAQAIEKVCGSDALVFPGALQQDKAAVANKILARAAGPQQAREAARAASDAVHACLHGMAEDAWPKGETYFDRDRARKQLDELMEIFWVQVPEHPDYPTALERAETLLAARKATKDWGRQGSSDGSRGVPKSSLDGARESVIGDGAYRSLSAESLRKQFGVKQGREQLCGVALLKRRGVQDAESDERRPAFHSTSHMAAAPLLARLPAVAAREYVERFADSRIRVGERAEATKITPPPSIEPYVEVVLESVPRTFCQQGRWGYDGVLLFEERLAPDVLGSEREGELGQMRQELREVLGGLEPVPYYAMLLADGDRMGDAIQRLARTDDGWSRHKEFSSKLDGFALAARGLVEDHGGSLIYAGGDDVLALLPLHTALACADALRCDFVQRMGEGLTLSVGLAIVHHLTPMDRARVLASQAERAAKDAAGRDALAVVMDKRSGATITVYDKWGNDLRGRLDRWAAMLHAESLPSGVAYELERMLGTFEGTEQSTPEEQGAIEALARQIIARKRAHRGQDELEDGVKRSLHDRFMQGGDPRKTVEQLSNELQIARLLLRAYDLAWGLTRPSGGDHV